MHLAALVALDDSCLMQAGVDSAAVRAVVLLDGAGYDVEEQARSGGNQKLYRTIFTADPAIQRALSPIAHIDAQDASTAFLLHYVDSRKDSRKQAQLFSTAFEQSGVPVRQYGAKGKTHRSINQEFGMPDDLVTQITAAFLQSVLSK